jgi:endonuclease/exonuclease/phosphatase family metal-dependent hydrolase
MTRRQLLLALAAGGASACAAAPPLPPVTRPDPQRFESCPLPGRTLSVLTWNIFMMPPWIRESPRNTTRAAAIGAALLEHDFDILCLEKAFDGGARDVLQAALDARYPYRYGPANDGCCFKIDSGVWVLSRHPLTDYRTIEFGDCGGVECFSRKGAILVSGSCGGTPFRLVATHLQGEEGPKFTPKNQRIREAQMQQIRDRLITPNLEPSVPFLICGDLGTPRFTDDGRAETDAYRTMLATFGAENGAEPRITLDESRRDNDLATDDTGRKNELDYVLVRPNGRPLEVERTRHVFRRDGWDKPPSARVDLSYRYAVSARITFG